MKRAKLILITLVIMLATILLSTIEVNATLQANPNTHYKKTNTTENWKDLFRNMEKQGEGMGLSETLKSDLSAESASNNIDVHMVKSTEFGAVAILSASAYGNSQTLPNSDIKTTTGNNTGVYFSGANWEYVAVDFLGGYKNVLKMFEGVNKKYFDIYSSESASKSAKAGDALGNKDSSNPGCDKWHNSDYVDLGGAGYPATARGGRGLFSGHYYYSNASSLIASGVYPAQNSYSRGVAVCGEGL